MRGYLIANYTIHDPATYHKYVEAVMPVIAKYGGKLIIGDFEIKKLEGNPNQGIVAVEFVSVEAAEVSVGRARRGGQKGGIPPASPESSVRIFSNRHRKTKEPTQERGWLSHFQVSRFSIDCNRYSLGLWSSKLRENYSSYCDCRASHEIHGDCIIQKNHRENRRHDRLAIRKDGQLSRLDPL